MSAGPNKVTQRRPHRLDPVTLEVIRNALPAISDEMSVDLQRTSYNMMIYEVRDYCTALLDPDGALISQNIGGVSHFVADLGVVIKDAVARYGRDGFAPGDVLLHNHQATAGQHLNNGGVPAVSKRPKRLQCLTPIHVGDREAALLPGLSHDLRVA